MTAEEPLAAGVIPFAPTDLRGYLEFDGWRVAAERKGVFESWVRRDGEQTSSLLVPLDPTFADFATRMSVAVDSLLAAKGVPLHDLLVDILLAHADEISGSRDVPTVAGSVPWVEGEAQFEGLKLAYGAAAKATEEPARYYGKKRWPTAKAALSSLRMGQTKVGSYVVTAIAPTGPIDREYGQGVSSDLSLTGRRVTDTLLRSLSSLHEAVSEYQRHAEIGIFDETVQDGVSYDLVRGVSLMLDRAAGMELSVKWSLADRRERGEAKSVQFESEDYGSLERAQRHLYAELDATRVSILGTVTNLDRDRPGDPGVVEIAVIKGTDAKRVHVRVQDEYDIAINAHRGGLIRVRGRLEKEGQTYWLYDVSEFLLVDSEDAREFAARAPQDFDVPLF